jgi:hypothetical protein
VPFVLHSAWTPTQHGVTDVARTAFGDELAQVDSLDADLAAVARKVARDLADGVDPLA